MKRIVERTLEEDLKIFLEKSQSTPALSIREIFEILSDKRHPLILVFLSLPFCLPLQIPGLSTPFGLVIAFIGLRMGFGKSIWLPKKVLSKTISSPTIKQITEKSLLMIRKMKRLIHPRLNWLCDYAIMKVVNGLLIFLLGIILALPLPIPLTNLSAGWAIFLINLGLLESDGLFVILGYLISLATVIFFIFMFFSIKIIF